MMKIVLCYILFPSGGFYCLYSLLLTSRGQRSSITDYSNIRTTHSFRSSSLYVQGIITHTLHETIHTKNEFNECINNAQVMGINIPQEFSFS